MEHTAPDYKDGVMAAYGLLQIDPKHRDEQWESDRLEWTSIWAGNILDDTKTEDSDGHSDVFVSAWSTAKPYYVGDTVITSKPHKVYGGIMNRSERFALILVAGLIILSLIAFIYNIKIRKNQFDAARAEITALIDETRVLVYENRYHIRNHEDRLLWIEDPPVIMPGVERPKPLDGL